MKIHVFALLLDLLIVVALCQNNTTNSSANSTDANKDMYVIHAMVYQVGILTNKTDEKSANTTTGNQEALTVYRTNGSKFDLSDISDPLVTNVTAQSMVQVAPKQTKTDDHLDRPQMPWSAIQHLVSVPQGSNIKPETFDNSRIVRRSKSDDQYFQEIPQSEHFYDEAVENYNIFKRELAQNKTTVKVVKGSAMIPPAAGVQSVAIPPLLALNNNLSAIPVPIPNTDPKAGDHVRRVKSFYNTPLALTDTELILSCDSQSIRLVGLPPTSPTRGAPRRPANEALETNRFGFWIGTNQNGLTKLHRPI